MFITHLTQLCHSSKRWATWLSGRWSPELIPLGRWSPEFIPSGRWSPELIPLSRWSPEFIPSGRWSPEFIPSYTKHGMNSGLQLHYTE